MARMMNSSGCLVVLSQIQDCSQISTARLSKEIIDQAAVLTPQRQQQYLTGRILLAELLFQFFGIATLPEIITSANGRPSFRQPTLPDFNISHSGQFIMIAITNQGQIGIDLEIKRPRKNLLKLAKYSFSAMEYLWLTQLPESVREHGFWQLWTLRESMLKLAGKGVWQMKEVTINPNNQHILASFGQPLSCYSAQQDPLFWALATDVAITADDIKLYFAAADLASLSTQPLPELTLFHTRSQEDH